MSRQRATTLVQFSFPVDWTAEEREAWLRVWQEVRQAKEELKKIVFVSGVFDLFHEEHEKFLEKARGAGNFLVVGVESDKRVRETKGPDRPIDAQEQRLEHVMNTGVVDLAEILPAAFDRPEHHRAIIDLLRPHILAVSSHSPHQAAKQQVMELYGGELRVVHEHNPTVSTTQRLYEGTMNSS